MAWRWFQPIRKRYFKAEDWHFINSDQSLFFTLRIWAWKMAKTMASLQAFFFLLPRAPKFPLPLPLLTPASQAILPPPSRVVSRPNYLPLPIRMPATQATFTVAFVMFSSLVSYLSRLFFFRDLACSLPCLFTFYIVVQFYSPSCIV